MCLEAVKFSWAEAEESGILEYLVNLKVQLYFFGHPISVASL
jgi:hypothetical protein